MGMLSADPNPVIMTGTAGDEGGGVAIHQIEERGHLGAVAELRLCHQSGHAMNVSALITWADESTFFVVKGFPQCLSTGLQLLR
jgi:hypothetical protein